jgi:guanylate kinase
METNLYAFIGPSGSGKSATGRALENRFPGKYHRVIKGTDRLLWPGDDDVVNQTVIDLRNNKRYLSYKTNGGVTYLIDVLEIAQGLRDGVSQIVIVNNAMAIQVLGSIFPNLKTIFFDRRMDNHVLREILSHRGSDGESLDRILLQRITARNILYSQIASGIIKADHIILNTTVEVSVDQFLRIDAANNRDSGLDSARSGSVLYIIMSGTGPAKDQFMRMIESVPEGGKFIIPKYLTRKRRQEDGIETINVVKIPTDCLKYSFFGNDYGACLKQTQRVLEASGLGFVTVSDIGVAKDLAKIVGDWGVRVQMVYLHQPMPGFSKYTDGERKLRRKHFEELIRLYQEDLVSQLGFPVVLSENDDVLCAFVQRMCMEALIQRR